MRKKREMKLFKPNESKFDKIKAFYVDPENYKLSEDIDSIRLRLLEVFTLRIQGFTPKMIVKIWDKDKGLSDAQAYLDIRDSETLFGSVRKANKEGQRVIWCDWVEDYRIRCQQKGDLKSEGAALKMFAEYNDFKGDENPDFNYDKFINKEIHIHVNDSVQKKLIDMLGKGSVDLNNLDVTDIPYEDLDNDTDESTD